MAEWAAAAFLMARGHRIIARRFKTAAGEIDLITIRRGRIGFVEVKLRASLDACQASITPKLRQRVRAAADLWMARQPTHQTRTCGFDLIFIVPWSMPVYLGDAL